MKFKMKKSYWLYLLIILIVAFLVWIFTRSTMADSCSVQLNACLLKGKVQDFFPRIGSGFVCTMKNIGCLIGQAF